MELVAVINRTKYDFFRWRYELTIPKKLLLALGAACLVGLLAQVRIYIPWTPVPITGQTFAALLAGVVMGRWWGGVSMAIYAGLGFAGVPWFNGLTSGITATGGYIIGFILAALFLGYFTDRYVKARRFLSMLGLMLFASLVIIYLPGLIWLGIWLNLVSGTPTAIPAVIAMGAAPFIVGDIFKSVLAAVAAKATTPKEDYSR